MLTLQKRRADRNGFGNVVPGVNGVLEFRRTVVFIRDMDHDLRQKETLRRNIGFYTQQNLPLTLDTVWAFTGGIRMGH